MSLGERRNPGTNMSQNEQYLSNHPISTLTQSSWRRQKDVLPSIDGSQNLNRTGVLLPQINNGASLGNIGGGLSNALGPGTSYASYKFEAGPDNQQNQADMNQNPKN